MYVMRRFNTNNNAENGDSRKEKRQKSFPRRFGGRLTALLLTVIMLLSGVFALTSCSGNADSGSEKNGAGVIPPSVGKKVNSPVKENYFVKNNIELERITVTMEGGKSGDYFVISGLSDKDVEEKINEKIYKAFMKYIQNDNPPPYRGAKIKTANFDTPQSVYVDMSVVGSINNVLSLLIYRTVSYGYSDTANYDGVFFSEINPLNIELNTGATIKLEDMFADNVDALGYVNEYIGKAIEKSYYDDEEDYYFGENAQLKLAAPFTGIDANQKFYLNGWDGGIEIIIDYSTPEFFTDNTYTQISIPYSDKMAYTKRFMGKESIFTDKTVDKELIANSYDQLSMHREMSSDDNVMVSYYEKQPDYVIAEVNKLAEDRGAFTDAVSQKYAEYAANYGRDNVYERTTVSVISNRISGLEYIISEKFGSIYVSDANISYDKRESRYITYKKDSDEIMSVEELFKDPKDCNKLLKKAIRANMPTYYDKYDPWAVDTEAFIDEALMHVNGFYLSTDSLCLSYDCDLQDMAAEMLEKDREQTYKYRAICADAGLSFSNLGCDNLTIFK